VDETPEQPEEAAAQVVFRPLKSIQWPQRCVGCAALSPQHTLTLNTQPAVPPKRGGTRIVKVMTRMFRRKPAGPEEVPTYTAPICGKCSALLTADDVAGLRGDKDAELPEPYNVSTPLLARALDQNCVGIAFRNAEYAAAFAKANPGLVFASIEECLGAPLPKAEEPAPAAEAPAPAAKPSAPAAKEPRAPSRAEGKAGEAPAAPVPLALADATPPALPAVAAAPAKPAAGGEEEDIADLEVVEEPEVQASPPPARPAKPDRQLSPPKAEAAKSALAHAAPPAAAQPPEKAKPAASGRPVVKAEATTPPASAPVAPLPRPVAPALQAKPIEERVLEVLQGFPPHDGVYVTPEIPPEKIAAASRACHVPDSDCVLALVDCTSSGSAEDALVFGCLGIYYHNSAESKSAGAGAIPYTEFPRRTFGDGAEKEFGLDNDQFLDLSHCPAPPGKIAELFGDVQRVIGVLEHFHPPPPKALPVVLPQETQVPKDDVRQFAREHLPEGPIKAVGAAYWDVTGTLGEKLGLGSLLGSKEPAAAVKEHRVGLLAVIGDSLFVVDFGTLAGEDLTLDTLKDRGKPKVKQARLRGLSVECTESDEAGELDLGGSLSLTATFPRSCGADNPSRAAEIATAIRCS